MTCYEAFCEGDFTLLLGLIVNVVNGLVVETLCIATKYSCVEVVDCLNQ